MACLLAVIVKLCPSCAYAPVALQICREVDDQMDPEHITDTYSCRALHVQLQGINGLRASGLLQGNSSNGSTGFGSRHTRGAKAMSLYIRIGRFWVEKPLPALTPPG